MFYSTNLLDFFQKNYFLRNVRNNFCNTEWYSPFRAVRISPLQDRYTNSSLPGGTIDWGCFRPVIAQNWSITIDFNCHRPLKGDINLVATWLQQGRKNKREKKREKKRENLESDATLPRRSRSVTALPRWTPQTRRRRCLLLSSSP
ncbi:hypothetical protein GW17_00058824 [Ensete ventricosum]|nr:hypothetical protein GW17_00058824 [Ensete ventricosum]